MTAIAIPSSLPATAENYDTRSAEERFLEDDPWMRDIVSAARAAGCIVRGVPIRGKIDGFSRNLLSINGLLCGIHVVRATVEKARQHVYPICFGTKQARACDAMVTLTAAEGLPRRCFVMPIGIMRAALPELGKRLITLYAPTERLKVYNKPPAIDFWLFENTWHILAPKAHEPDSS